MASVLKSMISWPSSPHSRQSIIPRTRTTSPSCSSTSTPVMTRFGLTPSTNGNGATPDTKVCPIHSVAMRRRTGKGGDVWYSHKAIGPDGSEFWCRGKAK